MKKLIAYCPHLSIGPSGGGIEKFYDFEIVCLSSEGSGCHSARIVEGEVNIDLEGISGCGNNPNASELSRRLHDNGYHKMTGKPQRKS